MSKEDSLELTCGVNISAKFGGDMFGHFMDNPTEELKVNLIAGTFRPEDHIEITGAHYRMDFTVTLTNAYLTGTGDPGPNGCKDHEKTIADLENEWTIKIEPDEDYEV